MNASLPPMASLGTSEGALRYCEYLRQIMPLTFLEQGQLVGPVGIVLAQHDVEFDETQFEIKPETEGGIRLPLKTGARLAHVQPMPLPTDILQGLPDAIAREVWVKSLRHYCALCRAVGVIVVGESWRLERPLGGMPMTRRDVESQPDRTECLYLSLEHRKVGRRVWEAQITRGPLALGAWVEYQEPVRGPLVSMLPEHDPSLS